MLDKDKKEILPAVSCRDNRTSAVQNEVAQITSQQDLYSKTGIQKQNFNTIYQLYCDKKSGKLDNAEYFLMIPDYLSFKLTGIIKNEYTNATTTNLVNAQTKEWDKDILDKLEIKNIFRSLSLPKTVVGESVNLLRQRLALMPRLALLKPVDIKQTTEDYTEKLALLRKQLKKYTGFEYSVIPESVVEAFIEKIWVSKDEFRWYLRTGKEANSEFNIDDHIKIGEFTITLEDAKKYLYSFSTRRRVYKWKDLNVSVWI